MPSPSPLKQVLTVEEPSNACDFLALRTGLPKARIKDCMTKGGVWRLRPGRQGSRLRRATAPVHPGETLEINYDPALLAIVPDAPALVFRHARYSVWDKPAGVLSQGTRFADHCAMTRLAQNGLGARSELHPVHRLDREARGLILMAHDKGAAGKFGELFRRNRVEKEYMVVVRGVPDWTELTADAPLDGRESRSHFRILARDPDTGTALVAARIDTGRRHQIRRHLAEAGFPVMGDPRYGRGNAFPGGLQLIAVSLSLTCPFTGAARSWTLPGPVFPPNV
jgi:tRNA pseudouridine32 synthase/23S rRNA pseudouridine746 synthase